MAKSCTRGGSGCILGTIYSPKEQCCSGTAVHGVVGSLSLREFTNHGNVALRDMVSGHRSDVLIVGLHDLKVLSQP